MIFVEETTVARVTFVEDDLALMLDSEGYEPSYENVSVLLDTDIKRALEYVLVEIGNDMILDIIKQTEGLIKKAS